ncbi:MAG: hypothetical protein BWX86_01163 [Verrucomicrobia bacterium ADurb.Bin122]|nr:MAG: hypothetical protein BWX86_01163 [Verrucomicrobia bacterium ADurb.Bin122]
MGARPRARRLLRRQRRGPRRRRSHRHARLRHRRLHPPARRTLRHRRHEADLRTHFPLRPDRLRLVARPDRPVHPHGGRRRDHARHHRRPRSARLDVVQDRDPRLPRRAQAAQRPVETRRRQGIFRRRSRPRGRRLRAARHRLLPPAGLRNQRGLPAAHEIRRRHLLHHRDRRVFLQPRALRRHPLRPPQRQGHRRHRHLLALARRGLRPRSEAPHHPRHLRALQRLLRRLLPPRPESPRPHPPGLPQRVQGRGRHPHADLTHARV